MTITDELLAPIRPNNGEVDDNMHEEGEGAAEEAMGEESVTGDIWCSIDLL